MSAKGAWARKGGAQLFPQNSQAPEKPQEPSTSVVPPKSATLKPANLNPAELDNKNLDQQPVAKTVQEDVSAESLAAFFVLEQKQSESNGPRTIPEWNGYFKDLWEKLRRDNVACSATLKAFVSDRFEEILGWTGTEFVASQVVSARQLELLYGLLLNHLSSAQNYNANSVVSTDVPLSTRAEESKIHGLQLEGVDSQKGPKMHGDGGKSNYHHERKTRTRQNRGRNSNGNRSSNNSGGNHSPGVQYTGKVTRWGSQGFGFIKPDDGGEDLHVNSSDLVGDFNALIVGRRVVFTKRFNERARKYKACRVSGEACTTSNAVVRTQRRPRRRHHRGNSAGYGDNAGNGSGGGNGGGYGGSNGIANVGVGFPAGGGGYGGVPYGGVHYGGVPYTFGGFPAGGFGYGGGVQMPPLSPTGAPGYGSPPFGSMSYGGPPISPVSANPPRVEAAESQNAGAPSATTGGGDDEGPPPAPPADPAAPAAP